MNSSDARLGPSTWAVKVQFFARDIPLAVGAATFILDISPPVVPAVLLGEALGASEEYAGMVVGGVVSVLTSEGALLLDSPVDVGNTAQPSLLIDPLLLA